MVQGRPGPLILDGPLPPEVVPLEVQEHPEFLRYRLPEFWVELTPARLGAQPVCSGGGADLWVRRSLTADESFDLDPLPPVVEATCARLEAYPPRFPAPANPAERAQPGATPLRALLGAAGLALLATLLPTLKRWWPLLFLALALRWGLSPRSILLSGDAPFERLLSARGVWADNAIYGEAWPALMGPFWKLLGREVVHEVNLVVSALLVPLGAELAGRREGEWAGWSAGLLLALLPLPLALAGFEDHFVLVATLQAACALGGWPAALAGGLLVHLRPEQLAFLPVPLGILLMGRRWGPLALLLGLVGLRLAGLSVPEGGTPLQLQDLLSPGIWRKNLVLAWPSATPALLLPLALVALAPRRFLPAGSAEVKALPLLLPLGLSLGPYLAKIAPLADPLRFQLPGQLWGGLLAALGLWRLPGRWRAGAALGLVVSGIFARDPLGGRWANQAEYEFLRSQAVPPGQIVAFNPALDENGHIGEWLGPQWRPWSADAPPQPGEWRFYGLADAVAPGPTCPEAVVVEERVPGRGDGWLDLPAELRLVLVKVTGPCARDGEGAALSP